MKKYYILKRIIDVTLSTIAFLLLWPAFVIIAGAIKLDSKGPVFFMQERIGQYGKIFNICKFRTMVDGAINMSLGIHTNREDPRITRVGAFLRKTSLDEIPQIINVFKGEMSIVGPRPPVPYYPRRYEEYSDEQKIRFLVKPGITGYAQIKVRNNATWDERISLDLKYLEKISFWFDWYVVFKTIIVVLKRENIYYGEASKRADLLMEQARK